MLNILNPLVDTKLANFGWGVDVSHWFSGSMVKGQGYTATATVFIVAKLGIELALRCVAWSKVKYKHGFLP